MALNKNYLSVKGRCKVRFSLPGEQAGDARSVHLVGEFNGWNTTANPMRRLKSGEFTTQVNLDIGKEYQFRYLVDQHRWLNDDQADRLSRVQSLDVENSVVVV